MKIYNVKKSSVERLLESLAAFGVCKADIRQHMDFHRDGSATYYAKNFMEHAALRSIHG